MINHSYIQLKLNENETEYIGFNNSISNITLKSEPENILISKFGLSRIMDQKSAGDLYVGDTIHFLHQEVEGFIEGAIDDSIWKEIAVNIQKENNSIVF